MTFGNITAGRVAGSITLPPTIYSTEGFSVAMPVETEDLSEDVERRLKELRGWMLKGTRPRRTVYLAKALYDICKDHIGEFPEAEGLLKEFADYFTPATLAAAIFDGEEISDEEYQRKYAKVRPAFGGGYERV